MRKTFFTMLLCLMTSIAFAQHWTSPSTGYQSQTIINAQVKVDGVLLPQGGGVEFAAFIDGECRGVSDLVWAGNQVVQQTIVYGNSSDMNKVITFKAYYDGLEYSFTHTEVFDGETHPASGLLVFNIQQPQNSVYEMPNFKVDLNNDKNGVNLLDKIYRVEGNVRTPFSQLECLPEFSFSAGNFTSYYDVQGNTLTPLQATTVDGGRLYCSISGTNEVFASVYVTPLESKLVQLEAPATVKVGINESVDLKYLLTYTYAYDINVETRELITRSVAYADVPANLKDNMTWMNYSSSDKISVSGSIVTGLVNSTIEGESVDIFEAGSVTETNTTVLVTPIDYEINGINLPESITVEKGHTANLLDYVTFTVLTGYAANGDRTYAEVTASELLLPAITWEVKSAYATVSGNTLTALASTDMTGVDLTLHCSDFQPSTKLLITPFVVPITRISIKNAPLDMTLGMTHAVTIEYEPADALFDPELLEFRTLNEPEGLSYGTWEHVEGNVWNYTPLAVGRPAITGTYHQTEPLTIQGAAFRIYASYPVREGWSWTTFFSLTDTQLTPQTLSDYMPDIIDMRSQNAATYNDPELGFFGSLSTVDINTCYKIKVAPFDPDFTYFEIYDNSFAHKTVATNGLTITLQKEGWNWLAYPYQYSYDLTQLAAALKFTGVSQATLVAKDGSQAVWNGTAWAPSTFTFHPGEGYLLNAPAGTRIAWPSEVALGQPTTITPNLAPQRANLRGEVVDIHAFADVMPIIAETEQADATVYAYVNGELRGISESVEIDGRHYLLLGVQGKVGEQVTFGISDGWDEVMAQQTVTFQGEVGSLAAPLHLVGNQTTGIEAVANGQQATVIDLSGRRVDAKQLPAGIYVIRDAQGVRKAQF